MLILGNVQVAQPNFAIVDGGEGVDQRRVTRAQALDLGAKQRHARLVLLQDRIVMARFAIAGDDLFAPASLRSRCVVGHSYRRTYMRKLHRR